MVPGNQLECGLLEGRWKHAESSFTSMRKDKKWPKEDTEHEIQTSDKLIWCFRVLRASPAAAAATTTTRRGVSNCVAFQFTLKSLLRQMKNYGNSNISPSKTIPNLQKKPLKETKILQDIIMTGYLISSFNTSQKYQLSKILI
jgi:hypothetical protein